MRLGNFLIRMVKFTLTNKYPLRSTDITHGLAIKNLINVSNPVQNNLTNIILVSQHCVQNANPGNKNNKANILVAMAVTVTYKLYYIFSCIKRSYISRALCYIYEVINCKYLTSQDYFNFPKLLKH